MLNPLWLLLLLLSGYKIFEDHSSGKHNFPRDFTKLRFPLVFHNRLHFKSQESGSFLGKLQKLLQSPKLKNYQKMSCLETKLKTQTQTVLLLVQN